MDRNHYKLYVQIVHFNQYYHVAHLMPMDVPIIFYKQFQSSTCSTNIRGQEQLIRPTGS